MHRFFTNCAGTSPEQLSTLMQLVESKQTVTRETFKRHVDPLELREIERELGYASRPSRGLTMARDQHVSYWRSTWDGRTAYGFDWSAYEYIFTEE